MTQPYRASDVFVPATFPQHTYVEREDQRFEERLQDSLDTPGQIVSISGPSKSGKTVLVEKVVSLDNLITVTGGGIHQPEQLWDRVLDWMDAPSDSTTTSTWTTTGAVGAEAGTSARIPLLAKGEAKGKIEGSLAHSGARSSSRRRRGLQQIIDDVANSDFVVLIDDYHYMARETQTEVAKEIKEAARRGVKIVTASVPHRSDDVVRSNPELRGRVLTLDLGYWEASDLRRIATVGFEILRLDLDTNAIDHLIREAAGSPQLMQAVCLDMCREVGVRHACEEVVRHTVDTECRARVFEQTARTTDYRSLVDVLDQGPPTRGTERKEYRFSGGTSGDVYRCILKALALDPPALSFPYQALTKRTRDVCAGDSPAGSSIFTSCEHMARLAKARFQPPVVEWDADKQVLDVTDPYFVFYLRWSDRLGS